MRKVDDGEEKKKKKEEEKIMTFIVANNVIASRPPKRRPTGTPHNRSNMIFFSLSTITETISSLMTLVWTVDIRREYGKSQRVKSSDYGNYEYLFFIVTWSQVL